MIAMLTVLAISPPFVAFNKKCPVCNGIMADVNKFCCYKCYLKSQNTTQIVEESILDGIL